MSVVNEQKEKKWIHCFDDIRVLLFIVAISDFNLTQREEEINRLDDALNLFKEIISMEWFQNTAIILFLNKIDIFQQKIKVFELSDHFPDYHGRTPEDASKFIKNKFLQLGKFHCHSKTIYHHFTCATETKQISVVVKCVEDIVLQSNLFAHKLM